VRLIEGPLLYVLPIGAWIVFAAIAEWRSINVVVRKLGEVPDDSYINMYGCDYGREEEPFELDNERPPTAATAAAGAIYLNASRSTPTLFRTERAMQSQNPE
jgi:hypothetical protein